MSVIFISFFAIACSPVVRVHGNPLDFEKLNALKLGESRREDVMATLGSPTTVPPFKPNTWIYMGSVTETTAFFRPETTDRKTLRMEFNALDLLETVTLLDENDTVEVAISKDKTHTGGNEFTVLQQLVGNIGRFNTQQAPQANTSGGGNDR